MDTDNISQVTRDYWLVDFYSGEIGLRVHVEEDIFHETTPYQDVKIVVTKDFGRVLLLNDLIYRVEIGGSSVPEMIVHVAMQTGDPKRRVLLIGGGDGYSLSEVLKYQTVDQVDVVDIDEAVIRACRQHFPVADRAFRDPRVRTHVAEGYAYLRSSDSMYDVVLSTPTEAFDMSGAPGISWHLFQDDFFARCSERLAKKGIFVTDGGAGYYDFGAISYKTLEPRLAQWFRISKSYLTTGRTIPGGLFVLSIASKFSDPETDIRGEPIAPKPYYYTPAIHRGSFALPQSLRSWR